MRAPRMDGRQLVYLSLAISTMTVLYGYTKFAMPYIIRWIQVAVL